MGTLHEDQHTFSTISRSALLRMKYVSDESCRENQNTHFVFSNFFFFQKSCVYEKMWKNIVEQGRPQMTIWRIRTAFWIIKATNTNSGYVILTAIPLQQWLHERLYRNDINTRTLPVLSNICQCPAFESRGLTDFIISREIRLRYTSG